MGFGATAHVAADFVFAMTPTRHNQRDVDPPTVIRIRAT
jgi:hypothetical protein